MKKFLTIAAGFTLAEVLITLTVIGVIAALTIPSLIQDVQNAQNKTALKSFYSDLSSATKMIMLDNGGTLMGVFTNITVMKDLYAEKMNIIKKCDTTDAPGNCWHLKIDGLVKMYDGTNDASYASLYTGIALTNGALVSFRVTYPNCDGQYSGLSAPVSCAMVRVDVNGFRGPNQFGYDIFDFHVLPTLVSPRGGIYDTTHTCSGTGGYCAGAYLKNG